MIADVEMNRGPMDGATFVMECDPLGDGGPPPLVSFFANITDIALAQTNPDDMVEVVEVHYRRQRRPGWDGCWHYLFVG